MQGLSDNCWIRRGMPRFRSQARGLSPGVEVLPLSVRTGENVGDWYAFLEDAVSQAADRGGAAHGARVGT